MIARAQKLIQGTFLGNTAKTDCLQARNFKTLILNAFRYFFYVSLSILAAIFLQQFCYKKNDGFALYKIFSSLTPYSEWETADLTDSEKEALSVLFNQPFYYLNKGAQAYVFVSKDQTAVIKFCRFDHLRSPFWFANLVFPFVYEQGRIEKILKKRAKLEQEFRSYKIAMEQMKEETGLIYLHLNKTTSWNKTLTIYDKIGIAHKLDLDQIEFIVQKKADLVYPTISQMMKEGKEDLAKQAISQLIKLLTDRYSRGIFDKDPDILTNFGFLSHSAVQIDIGRFFWKNKTPQTATIQDEILRITDAFRVWLEQKYPTLSTYLLQEIEQLESIEGNLCLSG